MPIKLAHDCTEVLRVPVLGKYRTQRNIPRRCDWKGRPITCLLPVLLFALFSLSSCVVGVLHSVTALHWRTNDRWRRPSERWRALRGKGCCPSRCWGSATVRSLDTRERPNTRCGGRAASFFPFHFFSFSSLHIIIIM